MKKKTFIILFVVVNILIIFLYIHKQSTIIKLSFKKQRNEKIKEELIVQKNRLEQQVHTLSNKATVKEYATQKMGMKKIALQQITVLPSQAVMVNEN